MLDADARRRDRRARSTARRPAPRSPTPPRACTARAAARCSSAPARSHACPARPGHHVARHRTRLHQQLRELRAATRRAIATGERTSAVRAAALSRKATAAAFAVERASRRAHTDAATLDRTTAAALERRRRDLDRILGTLAAHDPQRTLERGYALLEDESGEPITSAAAAREQPSLTIRLHDGRIQARPERPTTRRAKRAPMSAAAEDDGPRLF